MSDIKVLFVVDKSGFGGVQSIAYSLMEYVFDGVDITYFFLRNINETYGMADLVRDDVIYSEATNKYSLSCFLELYNLVKSGGYDIIHLNGTKSTLFGYLLKRLLPCIKLISHDHSSEFDYKGWYARFLKATSGCFESFLCVSERRKQFLVDLCNIKAEKVFVLNNFVDEKRFVRKTVKTSDEHSSTEVDHTLNIGFVGRLSHVKGCDLLIRALPLIKSKVPEIHVRIAGEGPDHTMLEELAVAFGVSEQVAFLGYVEDPMEVYSASDTIVIPSRSEEGPISLYEAWMVGVPVVASNAPVIDQRIEDYKTGLLFPSGDWEALAQKILELYSDNNLQSKLVANGYEAAKNLTAKNYVAKLEELYASV